MATGAIVVESRREGSPEFTRRTYELERADTLCEERKRIEELVRALYPDALLSVHSDDEARFEGAGRVIVARPVRPAEAASVSAGRGQEALFGP
jgi:hypothetical protein